MTEKEMKDSIRDSLEWLLTKETVKGEEVWGYLRSGYGGRGEDFIPISYLTEDEIEMLSADCYDDLEREYGEVDDYDLFEELFNEVLYDEMM